MDGSRSSRIARYCTTVAVVVTTTVAFAALGGTDLAQSAIGHDQYGGPVRHIAIVKASATRTGLVAVRVAIIGWRMYPGLVGTPLNRNDGGHWVIFVDRRCNNVSASRTSGKTKTVRRGIHKVFTELVNNDGSYLRPAIKSKTIRVRVTRTVKKRSYPVSRLCVQPPGTPR